MMIQAVIQALIYIVVLAIVVYLVIWVLTTIANIPIPEKIIQLVWVAFALVCILILVQLLLPGGLKLGRLAGISSAEAKTSITVHKAPRGEQPPPAVDYKGPWLAVVPVAVAWDWGRRNTCDMRVAYTGGPGFDPKEPTVGNFLVPAIYRSECGGHRPKWYKW